MSIWGAIVGGAAGFALGGPLGGILGAALGHAAERAGQQTGLLPGGDAATATRDNTKRIAFTIAVIVLGAKMAKADGRVTRDEVNAFKQVFRVPPEQSQTVARIFNAARQDSSGYTPYARQIAGMFADRPAVLEELVSCLFAIAKADGRIHETEIAFLADVARLFGLDEATFERLRNEEIGPDRADPYTILGVGRGNDDATIKTAYRKLVREHHPDRLIAQGMPQEFIDVATDKLARINTAYARIRAERGFD
ncbi:MAG: TerB family tellurite resistance protein [Azospirillaceae bacterium]